MSPTYEVVAPKSRAAGGQVCLLKSRYTAQTTKETPSGLPKYNVEDFVESQSFILPQVLMRSCKRDRLDPDTVRGLFVRAHRAPVINQPIDAVLHRGGARVHESLQPS